ncbi:hypothetical protein J5N97_004654 [Dioscorea zingiberensis]|uniref:Uncharacterized protein n=1 Tax=Dioscorea zingiberensis TaxID=325984 RepID=A0A9D5HRH5_9LILI|nr:hypothetical protein J5N97_004654 [Dioscorea zingiberensis]
MDTVVLYPSMGIGHLAPMIELAKLLTSHGLSVSVIVLPPVSPFSTASSVDNFISGVSSSHPSISFHHLPSFPVSSPPTSSKPAVLRIFTFLRAANPHFRDLLRSLS